MLPGGGHWVEMFLLDAAGQLVGLDGEKPSVIAYRSTVWSTTRCSKPFSTAHLVGKNTM